MEKQAYLHYFLSHKKQPSHTSLHQKKTQKELHSSMKRQKTQTRIKSSQGKNWLQSKHLSHSNHANKSYEYRITNQLLLEKILNPKRDKMITGNFVKPKSSNGKKRSLKSRNGRNPSINYNCQNFANGAMHQDSNQSDQLFAHYDSGEKQNLQGLSTVQSIHQNSNVLLVPPSGSPSFAGNWTTSPQHLTQMQRKSSIQRKSFLTSQQKPRNCNVSSGKRQRKPMTRSFQRNFNISLENDRMGRRIINTKSSVEDHLKKTFYTYKNGENQRSGHQNIDTRQSQISYVKSSDNLKKPQFRTKINNGVRAFFNPICQEQSEDDTLLRSNLSTKHHTRMNSKSEILVKSLPSSRITEKCCRNQDLRKDGLNSRTQLQENSTGLVPQHSIVSNFPQCFKVFGKGPTILMLYNFKFTANPGFKDDTILMFELVTNQNLETSSGFYELKQKSVKTSPIAYQFLKAPQVSSLESQQNSQNCLKFAINVSGIGDFVPLKIFKINGVDSQELGIVDIPLQRYKFRNGGFQVDDESAEMMNFSKEFKRDNHNGNQLTRDVYMDQMDCRLRKKKLENGVDIRLQLSYKIYSKKFR